MAVSHRSEFNIEFGTNNYLNTAFKRDRVKRAQDYDSETSGTITIAGGATVVLGLGGIASVKHAIFESDGALTLLLNTTNSVPMAPAVGQLARAWMDGTALTAISVTNSGSASVKLAYLLAGN